jgi:hypothetical protein
VGLLLHAPTLKSRKGTPCFVSNNNVAYQRTSQYSELDQLTDAKQYSLQIDTLPGFPSSEDRDPGTP